jgi:hypothetical protein
MVHEIRALSTLHQEIIMKTLTKATIATIAAFAAFATQVNATGMPTDTTSTDGTKHVLGPRDPYTDGGKASKFDVYSDIAKITDPRDPYTDGAHS